MEKLTKKWNCPEPGCEKTTQSFLTLHTHVIYKHDLRPSEARTHILSNLSKLKEVENATGTEGREGKLASIETPDPTKRTRPPSKADWLISGGRSGNSLKSGILLISKCQLVMQIIE